VATILDRKQTASCSAIVCAYNEESTLEGVVMALLDSTMVDEVIVIDDGSTDMTPQIVRRLNRNFRVHGVCFPKNRGKGYAMAEGVLQAQGASLLFVDADLLNFTRQYAIDMLDPLLAGDAALVIGLAEPGDKRHDTFDPFRPLSGQRALWKADLLPLLPIIRDSGYGVETLMTLYYRQERLRSMYVALKGLNHPIKVEKVGLLGSLEQYAHELRQIVSSALLHYPLLFGAYGMRPDEGAANINR
jgi:glycosyltransferase involved in cell wall biosynthesis